MAYEITNFVEAVQSAAREHGLAGHSYRVEHRTDTIRLDFERSDGSPVFAEFSGQRATNYQTAFQAEEDGGQPAELPKDVLDAIAALAKVPG